MHAFKHHQAIVEEFYATREPWRWLHLVAGAQAAAISFGKNMELYEEAIELLHLEHWPSNEWQRFLLPSPSGRGSRTDIFDRCSRPAQAAMIGCLQ